MRGRRCSSACPGAVRVRMRVRACRPQTEYRCSRVPASRRLHVPERVANRSASILAVDERRSSVVCPALPEPGSCVPLSRGSLRLDRVWSRTSLCRSDLARCQCFEVRAGSGGEQDAARGRRVDEPAVCRRSCTWQSELSLQGEYPTIGRNYLRTRKPPKTGHTQKRREPKVRWGGSSTRGASGHGVGGEAGQAELGAVSFQSLVTASAYITSTARMREANPNQGDEQRIMKLWMSTSAAQR
jgi:hypothetical protein